MAACLVSDCGKPSVAKQYCQTHYMRLRRNGHVEDTRCQQVSRYNKVGNRYCTSCKEYLPTGDFNKWVNSPDGYKIYCKQCEKNKRNEVKYKLDAETYLQMSEQGCAICGGFEHLAVDHDHNCCPGQVSCGGCVRSILCVTCNVRMGIYENREWTAKADLYLGRFKH